MFTIIDYVQELFDVVAETESSATNISEASRTGSSSGHSRSSDGPRGPTKGAYVHELESCSTGLKNTVPANCCERKMLFW